MTTVVTLGEILVEILATRRGQTFRATGTLTGPYPSGAPAIFIDQVAKLGQPCGMIGRVGDDDFGWLNIERLRRDGVDVSAIGVDPERPTGSAFVTYEEGGDRHFVFNIRHSASGDLVMTEAAERLLVRCGHLHVTGSSLFSPALLATMRAAVERVKSTGGQVSFDPNIRRELAKDSDLSAFFDFVLDRCDLLLPGAIELPLLTGGADEAAAVESLLRRGIGAIVVKRGAEGASYFDGDRAVHASAPSVTEVDPTGAGDCFGATFIVCRLRGMPIEECLRYANASGARTVTIKGPMEGAGSFAELDDWLAERVR
jgi:sugar/nucleoside kinase (ribokinase family)